jgi:hypothetical protein
VKPLRLTIVINPLSRSIAERFFNYYKNNFIVVRRGIFCLHCRVHSLCDAIFEPTLYVYLVVWCSRVCMWSGRRFACSDDIYEIERRDSCQQRVFIWREMHGRLGSESPRELSHGSFSRSQRWPSTSAARISPQHVVPLGAHAHANALYHSVYIGDAPPLATPSPQKRVHKPTSAPNAEGINQKR